MRIVVAGLRPDLDALAELLGAEVDAHGPVVLFWVVGDPASDAAVALAVDQPDVTVTAVEQATEVIITAWRIAAEHPDVALLCRPPGWRHPLSAHISVGRGIRLVDVPSALS